MGVHVGSLAAEVQRLPLTRGHKTVRVRDHVSSLAAACAALPRVLRYQAEAGEEQQNQPNGRVPGQ